MRIGLDGTPLTVAADGTARYTAELSRALATGFPEDEVILLSAQPLPDLCGAPPNLKLGRRPQNRLERRWWTYGVAREMWRRQIDIFHGTSFSAPYVPLRPSVVSIHDLSPWRDPAWHPAAARERRRTPAVVGLGLATMVLTDTEAIRREVCDFFGLPPGRVAAVPLAAAAVFRPIQGPPPATPYLLYVGAIEPRKNLLMLVDAWREALRGSGVTLVLAGRQRADGPQWQDEPGLRLAGVVGDEELARLYSGALAVVYPSFYEGFGLPVVEAMSCGAAVVASRDAALMEVCGGAALHVSAADQRGWVEVMRALVQKPGLVREWRERSLRRAREFSWETTARMTREVYDETRQRFGN